MELKINREYLLKTLEELVSVPSPSGFTKAAIDKCQELTKPFGFPFTRNRKGNGQIEVEGQDNSYCVGVFTHVDTLGMMVRSINGDGTLCITSIGGNMFSTLDGEYVQIHTRSGKVYTGTCLSKSPAVHVFPDASTLERKADNMMVVIDEVVRKKEDTEKLGIQTGDFISVSPKFEVTPSGFIKSRYLDDKASSACSFALMELFSRLGVKPKYKTRFIMSTYEEIGHGAANIPEDINEIIALDMGCVGLDLAGHETLVSICPKDSSGPYDYDMTTRLIDLSKKHNLGHAVDIFPMYGSDASASLRAGWDVKAALIGPGVAHSHGMERTHIDGLENAIKLVYAYLTE